MIRNLNRRNVLRGMMGGAAINVGLPFLDCFLNQNGTAFAGGAPLPVCFGTWVQGLGLNPGFWEPKTVGANYENNVLLKVFDPYKSRINVFSGMKVFTDGKPAQGHVTGQVVGATGATPGGAESSIDSLIADVIGTKTRFRSLEVSCDGTPTSSSRRSSSAINPSEVSPAALYTRIFGPDFKDPNAADFTPDPKVMAMRSVLSYVSDQRGDLVRDLGASDKARLDEYFTSLREIEQQLDLQLQKPAPLDACTIPSDSKEAPTGMVIDDAINNGVLFSGLLSHALACGQTRVINVNFSGGSSNLRKAGSAMTFHMYTHEEAIDEKLGYQPETTWFMNQILVGFVNMLKALDSIREGDHTLLDRIVMYYFTDHGYARLHGLENMPVFTAGGANGRLKTGIHTAAGGDPLTRVGLTLQQALGVATSSWGVGANGTSQAFTNLIA